MNDACLVDRPSKCCQVKRNREIVRVFARVLVQCVYVYICIWIYV